MGFKFEIASGDKVHCVGSQMGGFYDLDREKSQKCHKYFKIFLKLNKNFAKRKVLINNNRK